MDKFEILEMSIEEEELFHSLTTLQQEFSIGIINGLNKRQAYFKAGGKAKSEVTIRTSIFRIATNHNVSKYIKLMKGKVAEIKLCNSLDVAEALMNEAGISRNKKGKKLPPPEDSNQSGRVSALKALTDYTGGFDKNVTKNRVEDVREYKDKPLSELYGKDKEDENNDEN